MKIVKYILSVFLIIAGFNSMAKGDFIAGLLILILGGIIFPTVSEKIKQQFILFQDKKIRYISYITLMVIAGAFITKSEAETFGSKEDILIKYIKNNGNDKSLQNIKSLIEIGNTFNNRNYSLSRPHKGYISEQYDSIKNVAVLTFNPKFQYDDINNIIFLKDDSKNGRLKGYSVQYEINKDDSISTRKTTITYSKIIKEFFTISDVPSFETFLNKETVAKQQIIVQKQKKIQEEKNKFNKIMGNDEFWNTYDPIVKTRIYNLILAKNCKELQQEFTISANRAEVNHTFEKHSGREVDLMNFIDKKLKKIGCYDN